MKMDNSQDGCMISTESRSTSRLKGESKTMLSADIRYNKKLSSTEKILYAEIEGLYKKQKRCWATNSYFARKFDLSSKTISRCISNLEKLGYIIIQIDKAAGNKRSIFLSGDTSTMSIAMDKNTGSSGQNTPEDKASLLIYKENNKTNSEREIVSHPNSENKNLKESSTHNQEKETCHPGRNQVEQFMKSLEISWLKEKEQNEAQAFIDYYSAVGWSIKGSKITNWQAAAKNWLNKSQTFNKNNNEYSSNNKSNRHWMGHVDRLSTNRNKEFGGTL